MEIILFTILILTILILSGLMSGSEAAILTISLAKAKELASTRKKTLKKQAKKLLKIKENLQKYISTIVILNNLINIVGSVYVGLLTTKIFGEIYLGIISAILTFLIIIFSEIIPKIYGEQYSEQISLKVASPLVILTTILSPVIFILDQITRIFIKETNSNNISEGEIKEMAALGHKEGSINKYENEVISNVFKMNDIDVYDIMVPSSKVKTTNHKDNFKKIINLAKKTGHTRFPVLKHNEIIGIINAKDLFKFYDKIDKFLIDKILRPIIYAPESMKIFELEKLMKQERTHIAIVVNEHGDFTGIVTLEDIIEELLGEIEDEFDKNITPTITQISEKKYHIEASENIEEINDKFDLELDIEKEEFSTLAGFIIDRLGKIPKVNSVLKLNKCNLRIIKANRKKIISVELFLKH